MRLFRFFSLLFVAISCSDPEYPQKYPVVVTDPITNVSPSGAEFHGNILSLGQGQTTLRYGFVWGQDNNPTITNAYFAFEGDVQVGAIRAMISNDLEGGQLYFVRAFVQTDKLIAYGNEQSFNSLGGIAPVITVFSPAEAFDETEITIEGSNFSGSVTGNVVTIGDLVCEVLEANSTRLKVKLPISEWVGDFPLSVVVGTRTALATVQFSILGPRILDLSENIGRVGDLIEADAEYLDMAEGSFVTFGTGAEWGFVNEAEPEILSPSAMNFRVPDFPGTNEVPVLLTGLPLTIKYARYKQPFTILNSWSKIADQVPMENYGGYVSVRIGNMIYVVGGRSLFAFNTTSKSWSSRKNFPGAYRFYGTAFSHEGKLYYGFGEGHHEPYNGQNGEYYNDLWQYDPLTDDWSLKGAAPIPERSRAIAVVRGDQVYVGFGWENTHFPISFTDFWEVDPLTNTWTEISTPLPDSELYFLGMVAGDKVYIISYDSHQPMWEFDPATGDWTQKGNYPEDPVFATSSTIADHGLVVSVANGVSLKRVYEYDPIEDLWIRRQTHAGGTGPIQFAEFHNGKLYFAAGNMWSLQFD
jgi:N-acetylneuraminic acid mutarotase